MNQPLTVLIVDDHESVRAGIKVALSRAGHTCIGEASTIAEARAQIAHTNPQVIVVDLSLPDGNGMNPSTTFGLGLHGIQERSSSIDGELVMTNTPAGITYSIAIPS